MRILSILTPCLLIGGCVSADPHRFSCGDRLNRNMSEYPDIPVFAEIRRDAEDFPKASPTGGTIESVGGIEDYAVASALRAAIEKAAAPDLVETIGPDKSRPVGLLFLSGGGQWGAFGAGYLNAWRKDETRFPQLIGITAISTGAMQSLFVAAGDYEGLEKAYSIGDQSDLATDGGIGGLLRGGSMYDTEPLRKRIEATLCPPSADGRCPMLESIAKEGRPMLVIGMVEANSGRLMTVDVTAMVRAHYAGAKTSDTDMARCVTGIALASSAVPGQLRPVQIDGTTYVDGGVRSSVFARFLADTAQSAAVDDKPHIWVIRNGPTVVSPDKRLDTDPDVAEVDDEPNVLRVAKRSYSTIVNQNEVTSIALLRQIYRHDQISLATADGYQSINPAAAACRRSPEQEERVFDPAFMRCLIDWGRAKYRAPGWIDLPPLPDAR